MTLTEITALPKAVGTGVNASVPVLSGLLYVTVGLGTMDGLLESAVTVKLSNSLLAPLLMPVSTMVC